ncbi:MAG: hypothetical protein HYR74_13445 [Candidatus Eisenbacteria bacterium]|nr:hypothetical protein [Candidatus Eisenbacteria bacterium]
MRPLASIARATVAIAVLIGCAPAGRRLATAPDDRVTTSAPTPVSDAHSISSDNGFFPVHAGNTWRYRFTWRSTRIVGGIVASADSGATEYDVEQAFVFSDSGRGTYFQFDRIGTAQLVRWYRQNGGGVYYADEPETPSVKPAASSWISPPRLGPLPSETTWLAYPLRVGRRWGEGASESVVLRAETLDLPIGRVEVFRIMTGSTGDWTLRWVGPCGTMRTQTHLETQLRDPMGRLTGTFVYDDHEEVVAMHLVDCARCPVCR